MRFREGTPRQKALFGTLVGTYLLGVVLMWSWAATLVGKPHSGIFWLGHVVSFGPAHVRDAGVEWGSWPLTLNGVDITDATYAEIEALERRELGETNLITVRRPDGRVLAATLPVIRYTWRHAFESFGLFGVLCAVQYLVVLGAFAFRPFEADSWALLAVFHLAGAAGTTLGLSAYGTPILLGAYFGLTVWLLGMSSFHLALGFPTPHVLLRRRPRVLYVIYGIGLLGAAATAVMYLSPHRMSIWPRYIGVLFFMNLAGLLLCTGRCMWIVVRPGDRLVRQRARLVLILALAAVYHRIFETRVVVLGTPVAGRDLFAGYMIILSSGLVLVYLTLRYDLVNARIAVRRAVAYAAGGAAVLGLVALGANVSPVLAVVGVLPVFFVLPRFNALVNRWLYPNRAQFPDLRRAIGDELLGSTTREDVLRVLAGAAPRVCSTQSGAAFLLSGVAGPGEQVTSSGETDISNLHDLAEEPLVQLLVATHQPIKRENLSVDPQFATIQHEARACMDRLNASVLLPIERDGRVIGGLAVGPHTSDDVYDRAELNLLRELAHEAVRALEVAELRERSSDPSPRSAARRMSIDVAEDIPLPSVAGGRYVAERLLGEGGSKRVYLAEDTTLHRQVALAVIQPARLDETVRPRILREARTMAGLGSHPHVVTVHDLGEDDGQLYVVSEYLPGGDLAERLAAAPEKRLPLADAVRVATEVCRALEMAHAQGIVHRDVKPGNIWFTVSHTAKLGDFGLAAAKLDQTRITQEGQVLGTAAYMAPEQARGEEAVPQSDLYALGMVLYEMVAGRLPFTGDNVVAFAHHHIHTTPDPPSQHNGALPPGLDTLILHLLAKAPADRPASAATVREALEAVSQ